MQTIDLDIILQAFYELYPEIKINDCYFLFDEIQNIEGWEKFIRRIFDTQTKNIFITGSNSKLLSTEIATSLRGRTISYTVFPLSLIEYLQFKNVDIEIKQQKADKKVYSIDTGLLSAIEFSISENKGKLLENKIWCF